MRNILLVKTSSMGDVVHNLPVVADIRAAWPDVRIDWVVESAFAAIPRMHAGVQTVIESDLRIWRKAPFAHETRASMRVFWRKLRAIEYDVVIDAQGLLKSALIARSAIARRRVGFNRRSAREPVASLFYSERVAVSKDLHAVARCRSLVARSLSIAPLEQLDYGIGKGTGALRPSSDIVLLHATSRADKCWPVEHWIALGKWLNARGLRCVLPAGNAEELARSDRIAAQLEAAFVPPKMSLDALAAAFAQSRAILGVDTGLVHLATALGRPTVALFVASDPTLTGAYGSNLAVNLGGTGSPPSVNDVIDALQHLCVC